MSDQPGPDEVTRRVVTHQESVRADRGWWDGQARAYYAEHGEFLGDGDLVWGPEGWTEEELRLLGDLAGLDVLEVGAGAAQGARWCAAQGARVLATDLSGQMLQVGREVGDRLAGRTGVSLVQCDGGRLPLAAACVDLVFTAHGVLSFVPDAHATVAGWARVLRPGGQCVFSVSHPFRWAFPDVPGPEGLRVRHSYFDRRAYVEQTTEGRATYTEHHRTVGDLVDAVVGAGLVLRRMVEPGWPPGRDHEWGGWSRTRGELVPGTLIVVADKPG
jgi:SAM-dependent methyltransferase